MLLDHKLILLADDHVIIRRGLKQLLENNFGKQQIVEADSTQDILALVAAIKVTHMILDMQLTDANVMEILPILKLQYPHISILIYTMSAEDIFAMRMLNMGAKGFLCKQSDEIEVIRALRLFFQGEQYMSNNLQSLLNNTKQTPQSNPIQTLSDRELSVLSRLIKGTSVKEISIELDLKPTTVATYKARIFEKTGVHNIMDLRSIADLYHFNGS